MLEINITHHDIIIKTKKEIKETTKSWDTSKWQENIDSKSSLQLYNQRKTEIKEVTFHDNRPSSIILLKDSKLPAATRQKKTHQSCKICHGENETLEHFLLYCPAYQTERLKTYDLQQPNEENVNQITFLFSERNIEKRRTFCGVCGKHEMDI